MPGVACPYCYHRISPHDLWYRCAGRGTPGQPGCTPEVDQARQRETGYARPCLPSYPPPRQVAIAHARPVCARCNGESGRRVCPCCHTPLPTDFGAAASPLIGLVGAKGTGKTVYLTVLAHELRTNTRRRFGADVRLSGDQQGDQASSRDWLKRNVDTVYQDHRLLAQTAPAREGRREPVVFEWRQEYRRAGLRRLATFHLSFYDTAGEDLTSQENTFDLAYLGAADALIVLLDPFTLPQARDRLRLPGAAMTSDEAAGDVLNRVTKLLRLRHGVRGGRRISLPVAVAFAKIDAFFDLLGADHPLLRTPRAVPAYDEAAGQETHEHILSLLHELGADDVDVHLRHNYSRFRYFAVSALGAPPNYENGEVDAGGVRPLRVDEPLVWLLSRSGVVPTEGKR
ncbi:MAG TPA: hypothetical protein VLJ59_11180 [Mycobacteriales bacterium]|nr:hypothetical protein [Mycobacteriales bacterium]